MIIKLHLSPSLYLPYFFFVVESRRLLLFSVFWIRRLISHRSRYMYAYILFILYKVSHKPMSTPYTFCPLCINLILYMLCVWHLYYWLVPYKVQIIWDLVFIICCWTNERACLDLPRGINSNHVLQVDEACQTITPTRDCQSMRELR